MSQLPSGLKPLCDVHLLVVGEPMREFEICLVEHFGSFDGGGLALGRTSRRSDWFGGRIEDGLLDLHTFLDALQPGVASTRQCAAATKQNKQLCLIGDNLSSAPDALRTGTESACAASLPAR